MTQTGDPASRPRRPLTIVVAAVLLTVEALIALAYAALESGQIRMSRAVLGVGVTILMAGFGLLLLLIARGVFLGRRWSRGPAVATQLVLLPLAWSFVGGRTTWVAVVLAALAIAVLVGVLHPRSTAVFVPPAADKTQP
jgi:predicted transporter